MHSQLTRVSNRDLSDGRFDRAAIEARLAPGSREEIAQALRIIFEQFPNVRDGGDPVMRAHGYVLALERYGLDTVKRCVRAVLDGRIGNPAYLPLAPEMAAWCRTTERFDREELARLDLNEGYRALPASVKRVSQERWEALSEVLAKTAIETSLAIGRELRSPVARSNSDGNRSGD